MKKYVVPTSELVRVGSRDVLLLSTEQSNFGMIVDYSNFEYID